MRAADCFVDRGAHDLAVPVGYDGPPVPVRQDVRAAAVWAAPLRRPLLNDLVDDRIRRELLAAGRAGGPAAGGLADIHFPIVAQNGDAAEADRVECRMRRMPHRHFLELREAIYDRLRTLRPPSWEEQIEDYPWLYGALGDANADVMFVCENPSLSALRAIAESPKGGPPDFDTQWTGNPTNRRDKRFRTVLCDLGLKDGGIWEPGGWHCYITNVIKQAAIVSEWGETPWDAKLRAARQWSEILQKELDVVRPDIVFGVGGSAHRMVKWLQRNAGLDVPAPICRIWHYSAYRGDEKVERMMRDGIAPYL